LSPGEAPGTPRKEPLFKRIPGRGHLPGTIEGAKKARNGPLPVYPLKPEG